MDDYRTRKLSVSFNSWCFSSGGFFLYLFYNSLGNGAWGLVLICWCFSPRCRLLGACSRSGFLGCC
ncbi:hypothetical protein BDR03DRAFT_974188 [Suillus americanus]|nr:hypothetical protein BDR03DRAFT_974188 [Suillus americanus]